MISEFDPTQANDLSYSNVVLPMLLKTDRLPVFENPLSWAIYQNIGSRQTDHRLASMLPVYVYAYCSSPSTSFVQALRQSSCDGSGMIGLTF